MVAPNPLCVQQRDWQSAVLGATDAREEAKQGGRRAKHRQQVSTPAGILHKQPRPAAGAGGVRVGGEIFARPQPHGLVRITRLNQSTLSLSGSLGARVCRLTHDSARRGKNISLGRGGRK
jgi:hypothetical protein